MYDSNSAKAIRKLLTLVEDVINGLDQKGFKVGHSFNKRWWKNGEFGCYIQCNEQNVLWFGLWQDYWENSGVPLCFGVHDGKWDARICAEFRRLHPTCVAFPSGDPNPFLVENIERDIILSDEPVTRILNILEKDFMSLCDQIKNAEKA